MCAKLIEKLKRQMWMEADMRVVKLIRSLDFLQEELLYKNSLGKRRSLEILRKTSKHISTDNDIMQVKRKLWTSLNRARSICESGEGESQEFIEAKKRSTESNDERFWPEKWANYKRLSVARKAWGSYLTQSEPGMDFLSGQSKALRRLFAPEHITKAFTVDIVDGIRCTISRADNNQDGTSVKIRINHTLSKGLKVELEVHGSNLEAGKGASANVTRSEIQQ